MFDRTVHVSPPAVQIDVKQQPNDAADAARLYGECVAKAEAEVAGATIIKFGARNELVGVRIDTGRRLDTDKLQVRLLFSINGEKFDILVEDDTYAMSLAAYREMVSKLFEKVIDKMLPPRGFRSIKPAGEA
jgi:hypothetical protein